MRGFLKVRVRNEYRHAQGEKTTYYMFICKVIQTQIVNNYEHINAQHKLFKTAYLNPNMRCIVRIMTAV